MEHTIELPFGYEDKKGVIHREVTFSRRLTAGDLMLLDNDPQAANPTQYGDLIRRRMITKFGGLRIPVDLSVLLSLNSIDRDELQSSADEFIRKGRGEAASEFLPESKVKMFFGFEIEGTRYPVAEIGRMNTGRDEVEADNVGTRGITRECFLLGRMITQIATPGGEASVEGPIKLDLFNDLDAEDLNLLRIGARLAEATFRFRGRTVLGERDGEGGIGNDARNGHERGGDSEPSAATAG